MFILFVRRKHYTLSGQYDQDECLCDEESSFDAVRHIDIQNEETMNNCSIFFPNATELIVSIKFCGTCRLITTRLNRIVPLIQLTILTINCENFPFDQLVEILRFTPNSHTLTLSSILFTRDNPIFSVGLDALRSIVYKNKLKNVIITNEKIFLIVTFFVCIYPRLEHFTIKFSNRLFNCCYQKLNVHTRHLFSLCFSNLDKKTDRKPKNSDPFK